MKEIPELDSGDPPFQDVKGLRLLDEALRKSGEGYRTLITFRFARI